MNSAGRWPVRIVASVLILGMLAGLGWASWSYLWVPRHRVQGEAALAAQDWNTATEHFESYLAARPDDVTAKFLIAEALAEQGRLHKSLEYLQAIPDDSPEGAAARWHEGSLLLQLNYGRRAEEAALRSLALDPESLDTRYLLTLIYRWEDRRIEGERLLWEIYDRCAPEERAMALAELFRMYYASYSLSDTARKLELFLANDESDLAARVALGRLLVGAGMNEKGLAVLTECWQKAPGNVDVRAAMVRCFLSLADYDRAGRLLDTWPAENRDVRYWSSLGTYQADHLSEFEAAAESFRRVLQFTPDDWRSRHRLGLCLQISGDTDQAQNELKRSAHMRDVLDRDRMEETLKGAMEAIKTAEGRYNLGRINEQVGRIREAEAWYREALALNSDHGPSREGLARLQETVPEGRNGETAESAEPESE